MSKDLEKNILSYKISGEGPVVVLLHGYLCSHRYWDEIRRSLEKNHKVIAVDLLGFGDSPKPRRAKYGYDDHLEWLERTLVHCGVDEPVLLAGHSMGALLALRYSAHNPNAVHRLLLMNIPLFKNSEEARRELANTNLFFRVSLYWEMHRLICPLMRTPLMRRAVRAVAPKQYKGMEKYMFASSAEARSRSLRNVIEAQNSLFDLERLEMPTTILIGAKERPAYLENVRALPVSDNLEIVLTDTGHHTPLDNPVLTANLLKAQ